MLLTPNLGNEMKKSCMGWSHETNSKDTISKEIDVESLIWRSAKNANFKNKILKHDFRAPYKLVVYFILYIYIVKSSALKSNLYDIFLINKSVLLFDIIYVWAFWKLDIVHVI